MICEFGIKSPQPHRGGHYVRDFKRFLLLRLVFATLAGFVTLLVASSIWAYVPGTTIYRVRETYSFRASSKPGAVRLAVMVPKTGPYQQVRNLAVSWQGSESIENQPVVDIVKLVGQVSPNEAKVATIDYEVILHQGPARWEGPVESFQLEPQPGMESKEPVLAQAALQLASGQTRQDAYRIHRFTAGRLSWHGQAGTNLGLRLQSALQAYQTGQGVCGHFANLMTALCRAAKIPAQSVSGLSMPTLPPFWSATRVWGHPAGNHGWIEFHTATGWELADPSAAYRMPFKSFSFGRSKGNYLSYGERISQDRTLDEMEAWAKTGGSIIGGMTGPLRFAAGADNRLAFLPSATVQVMWSSRWAYLSTLGAAGAVFTAWCVLHWRKQRERPTRAMPSPQPKGKSPTASNA